jgi:hypothetical protein
MAEVLATEIQEGKERKGKQKEKTKQNGKTVALFCNDTIASVKTPRN